MQNSGEDLYHFSRRIPSALRKLDASSISVADKRLILRFIDFCRSSGMGPSRILKHLTQLQFLAELLKVGFEKAKRKDVEKAVLWIEESRYAAWTKRDYKVTLKKFYKWLRRTEDSFPPEVRWIKVTLKQAAHKLPEEMLTEQDIMKMVNACDNPRDKALVQVLYESGCRIGELASLTLANVQFDAHGAQIVVTGKTGMRRIRLVSSVPALATWMDNHPHRNNPTTPLWTSIGVVKGKSLSYRAFAKRLKEIGKAAGIRKRLYPHLFRHSRATYLARHLTEAQLKEFFGWTQGSGQAATYVHLSGRDVDGAILKLYGLSAPKQVEDTSIKPRTCPRCETVNEPTGKFCTRCGMCLDVRTAIELEEQRKLWDQEMLNFVQDPDVQKLWQQKRGQPITVP